MKLDYGGGHGEVSPDGQWRILILDGLGPGNLGYVQLLLYRTQGTKLESDDTLALQFLSPLRMFGARIPETDAVWRRDGKAATVQLVGNPTSRILDIDLDTLQITSFRTPVRRPSYAPAMIEAVLFILVLGAGLAMIAWVRRRRRGGRQQSLGGDSVTRAEDGASSGTPQG